MCFAEKIIDSMVDENGHCGERGISKKQFYILAENLPLVVSGRNTGGWSGNCGGGIRFTEDIYDGYIGKYHVVLKCFHHFNDAHSVISIDKWTEKVPDFAHSEFIGTEKKRDDFSLMLVSEKILFNCYDGYHETATYLYTFADDAENCFVWFASKPIDCNVGGKLTLRATVKCHKEYRGIKQTVITRGKVI